MNLVGARLSLLLPTTLRRLKDLGLSLAFSTHSLFAKQTAKHCVKSITDASGKKKNGGDYHKVRVSFFHFSLVCVVMLAIPLT